MSRGLYIFGGSSRWYSNDDYIPVTHDAYIQTFRQYAIRSLGMKDGELNGVKSSVAAHRRRAMRVRIDPAYSAVPKVCADTIANGGGWCNAAHYIPNEVVAKVCVERLGMTGLSVIEKERVVEVERLVEVERIIEVPLALTFDERVALENALHRAQHVANEYLRRAIAADDKDEALRISARLQSILSVMDKLGIAPSNWMGGGDWLADTPMMHLDADTQLRLM